MKTKAVVLIIVLTALLIACGKDKFTTEPQIKAITISPKTVKQGNVIKFQCHFTDKEGDLDSVFVIIKWLNGTTVTKIVDTLESPFSNYNIANLKEGDLNVQFSYGTLNGYPLLPQSPVAKDTSSTISVQLKDKAGHLSRIAESATIRLIKP